MAKLFLLRHLKSQWNEENRFAGWTDGPLAKGQEEKAKELALELFRHRIDKIYSSPLFRNMDTVAEIFEYGMNKYPFFIHLDPPGKMQEWGGCADITDNDVPVYVSENLNERYYGKLQGLNKEETIKKYGEEQVRLWRRSFEEVPPGGESLKDVYNRVIPFYKKFIEKDLKEGKNILIVASHNSLRAVVKYIEGISNEDIADIELTFGALVEYDFDDKLSLRNKNNFVI
ncbi:MAG: 2,3-bisphosphoglycerate-dependent phosphoglycerate mutase [Parcubacteria group bacterium Licking1014_1]|nr:MAG: 2,3-bisphosphoglycerate-dependent phosphoglycerate mutase [Parcubacteria group bacterium Licking1014_1]